MPSLFGRLTGYYCAVSIAAAIVASPAAGAAPAAASGNLAGAPQAPAASAASPVDTRYCASHLDRELVDAAASAVRIAPHSSTVWPDFHIPAPAILIYRPGGQAILVSRAKAPEPFVAAPRDRLPAILRNRTFIACAPLPGLNGNFNTNYQVGPIRAVAVKLEATTYETLEVLFHESFHKFQDGAFSRTIGANSTPLAEEKRLDPDIVSQPEFVASMEVERRILAEAVKLGDARAVPLLRQYLAIRRQRRAGLPADVREAELNIERKEGSAAIVGSEIASRAVGRNPRAESDQLRMFMAEPPQSLPSGMSGYGRFRARAFGSGVALAWILTRLGEHWRSKLEHGASFEALLARAVAGRAPVESVDAIKTRFGYAQLLHDAQEWHKQYGKEASREDFYRTGPVRLVIEFPQRGDKLPEFKGQGTGLPSQPEDNVVIFMQAQAFAVDYGSLSIHADNRPYLLDLTGAPRLYRVEITLKEFPRVDGASPGLQNLEWTHGGTIEGPEVRVKIGEPAAIRVAKDSLTVSLGSAP